MKKIFSIILCVIFALGLISTGCGSAWSTADVTIGEYMGIEIQIDHENLVTDVMVEDAMLEEYMTNARLIEIIDRAAAEGDIVNIDYTLTVNGEEAGESREGFEFELGSGSFIPGAEEKLIGMEPLETQSINVTFSGDYGNVLLAGQEAVMEVTLNFLKEKPVSMTDNMVKEISDIYDTVEAYSDNKKQEMEIYIMKEEVWRTVLGISEATNLPESQLEYYSGLYHKSIEERAEAAGRGFEEYIAFSFFSNIEEFDDAMESFESAKRKYARDAVFEHAVAEFIARENNITVKKDEYEQSVEEFAEIRGLSEREIEKRYAKVISDALLRDLVLDFLFENAKIT